MVFFRASAATLRIESLKLSPLIKEITLRLPEDTALEFQPGAYVQVTAPKFTQPFNTMPIDSEFKAQWKKLNTDHMLASSAGSVTRAYSLANKTSDQNKLTLLIRLALPPAASYLSTPPGKVSSWLFALSPGDQVNVSGPFGDFRLHESEREMVLIGGGVGMAPLRSILHQELMSGRKRKVHFFYGARSQWDVFYKEELQQLDKQHEFFHYDVALSEPSQSIAWNGSIGFVHEILENNFLNAHSNPEECEYYLCGPPLMQSAVISVLDNAGVEADAIFADSFG